MKASILVKEVQNLIETEGDVEVEISVAKQPDSPTPDQQYLKASARFVVSEKSGEEKRISIRDWPY